MVLPCFEQVQYKARGDRLEYIRVLKVRGSSGSLLSRDGVAFVVVFGRETKTEYQIFSSDRKIDFR